MYTDLIMQSRRRWLLRNANAHGLNQTWSYEFKATNPTDPPYWGSESRLSPKAALTIGTHEAEKPYVFGRAVAATNYSQPQIELGETMMDYWYVAQSRYQHR